MSGLFWLALIGAAVLSVLPNNEITQTLSFWDKAQHALAFAVLAMLGRLGFPSGRVRLFLGLLVFGGLIELVQWNLPWREGSLMDWWADVFGVGVVWLAFLVVEPAPRV